MNSASGKRCFVWLLVVMITLPLSASTVRIYATNSAGDTVSVIDPVTNKVVQTIEAVELSHGVGFSPDGKRVYISLESHRTLAEPGYVLDVVDQKTGKPIKQVPLSGRPNTLAVSNDGGRVFVAITAPQGALDVIDSTSLERVKSIPMIGGLHDIYLTPDGKYLVCGGFAGYISVVDVQTEEPVWQIKMEAKVSPMAFEINPDGSTRRIFAQINHFYGFVVVDFATHKQVAKISLPDEPSGGKDNTGAQLDHGILVTPDNKTLWVNSARGDCVFEYSLPDLKLAGHVLIGTRPTWITSTPDSKRVYVSNERGASVSAIDTNTLQEVARIPTGEGTARLATLVLP